LRCRAPIGGVLTALAIGPTARLNRSVEQGFPMRRRTFFASLAVMGIAHGTMPTFAQVPDRIYRLAHLANSADSEASTRAITLPELARLGFVEGRNLVFEGRVGQQGQLAAMAQDLLASRPDAMLAVGPAAIVTAGATRNVPIVTFGGDPVQLGLAAGYARPGSNVTGVVILVGELEVKRLALLLEALPGRRRVAVLTSAATALGEAALRKAAAGFAVELLAIPVTSPADYPAAFAAMRAAGAQALVISATSEFFRDRIQLAQLALEARLPTVCEWAEMAHAGCFLGYGPDRVALRKRLAGQIARIFRGARSEDIAIELPTTFELAVNQRVARTLGITVPVTTLSQADDVIE
jgi:putative tryptophan/tyrosine transport system substrate-binding protein